MSSESFGKTIKQERKGVDKRIVNKHITTLSCLQETAKENSVLRHRVSELEGYKLKVDYYEALEKQVQSLQDELSKCEKLHALGRNTEEKINEIKEEYAKAFQKYREDMEERYKTQVQNFISDMEESAKAWKEEKVEIQTVVEELKERNNFLQKKLEAAAAMKKDMNNLESELDKTVASFEEIKTRNKELQESKDNLEELCCNLESENVSLEEALENSSYSKKKLKKEMNKMVMKITKYIKQIKELEKVKNTVSRLEFENSWVKHLHEKSVMQLNNLTMKHKDALSELQVITQDRNLLKNELSSVQQEISKLREELENSKHSFAEFLEIRKQVDVLQEENKSLLKKSRTYKVKMLRPKTVESQNQLVSIPKLKVT